LGALYGVKTYFKQSKSWRLIKSVKKPSEPVLERLVFVNRKGHFLIADAYRGASIHIAIADFLDVLSGARSDAVGVTWQGKDQTVAAAGAAGLVVYVGHNGLMDYPVKLWIKRKTFPVRKQTGQAMVLACQSRQYFQQRVKKLTVKVCC